MGGWIDWPKLIKWISNAGNSNQPHHFHILEEKEMVKNGKIFEIGPRLDMPPAVRSFTT